MQQKTQLKGVFILLITALIWGSSFVAQSVGMESVEAFTFNGIRTLLGAAVLIPFILVRDFISNKKSSVAKEAKKKENKSLIIYGSIIGVILCIASNLQQQAFNYSTSGKIAFITAFYMLFVPFLGLFIRKKVPVLTWICVALGAVGLYFLCITNEGLSSINKGDILALLCAVFYAVHILAVEKFAPSIDGVKLSCVQFIVSGTISVILMFIFENPDINAIKTAAVPILYSGVMSCGIAYTFQIIGQKYTESTVASLLMCMESVFGVICGAVILKEMLTGRELAGCVIMFVAIILSQLTDKIPNMFNKRKT
ncbi:MAG: DMT family transporter [Clostridia bacterium]|nr:DMT family transporter [Clostridia bacterium]